MPEETSIALQETNNNQQEAHETQPEERIARTKREHIKMKSAQSKWVEEVLNLLNTGSVDDLSKNLATIGPKTAVRIIRCREIHEIEFKFIDDLQKMSGWTEKEHKKFLSKNCL